MTRSLITWHATWSVSSIHWIYLTCPFDEEPLGSASRRFIFFFGGGQLSVPQTPKHQSDLLLMQPAQGLLLVQRATLAGRAQPVARTKRLVLISATKRIPFSSSHSNVSVSPGSCKNCVDLSSFAAAVVNNRCFSFSFCSSSVVSHGSVLSATLTPSLHVNRAERSWNPLTF